MDQLDEIEEAVSPVKLSDAQERQLSEVLYTVSELGNISLSSNAALQIHALVEMILNNGYTDKMRM